MIANYELYDRARRSAAIDDLENIIDGLTVTCDDNADGTQATRAAIDYINAAIEKLEEACNEN
jgi:hypothetical protein